MSSYFDENYRIVMNQLFGSTEVSVVPKSLYLEKINSKDLAFVFVSDNITWCQENVKFKNVYVSPFKDPGRDLCILTQCDHNIVLDL